MMVFVNSTFLPCRDRGGDIPYFVSQGHSQLHGHLLQILVAFLGLSNCSPCFVCCPCLHLLGFYFVLLEHELIRTQMWIHCGVYYFVLYFLSNNT